MSTTTKTRLTPRERLTRGLGYTAVGPVDITRGTLGLGLEGVHAAGSRLRERCEKARAANELGAARERAAREIAAAQEVVANLPQALQEARRPSHRTRRIIVFSAAGVVTLAAGAVTFSIIRRSMQPEPSPRPPSVEVEPKP